MMNDDEREELEKIRAAEALLILVVVLVLE